MPTIYGAEGWDQYANAGPVQAGIGYGAVSGGLNPSTISTSNDNFGRPGYTTAGILLPWHIDIGSNISEIYGAWWSNHNVNNADNLEQFLEFQDTETFDAGFMFCIKSFGGNGSVEILKTNATAGSYTGLVEHVTTVRGSAGTHLYHSVNGPEWSHWEVYFKLHASTGEIRVWQNGQTVWHRAGFDTRGFAGATTFNRIHFAMGGSIPSTPVADMIFSDTRVGRHEIRPLRPNAAGSNSAWTAVGTGSANYDRVDEGNAPDDTTTYVHTATAANIDSYNCETYTLGSTEEIIAVGVNARVRANRANTLKARLRISDGTTVVNSADFVPPQGNWRHKKEYYTLAPDGGAWDQTDLNNLQIGIESRA